MAAASPSLATALSEARFASGLLQSSYTTYRDTTVRTSACSPSWTHSAGSRPSSIWDSAIGPKTLSRLSKEPVHPWAIRRRSGSIKAPSLSAGTSVSRPTWRA